MQVAPKAGGYAPPGTGAREAHLYEGCLTDLEQIQHRCCKQLVSKSLWMSLGSLPCVSVGWVGPYSRIKVAGRVVFERIQSSNKQPKALHIPGGPVGKGFREKHPEVSEKFSDLQFPGRSQHKKSYCV